MPETTTGVNDNSAISGNRSRKKIYRPKEEEGDACTTAREKSGKYQCLDPELVGLGWTEIEYTFDSLQYSVYTSPHGLRCRSIEKAREMAVATEDLELVCCEPGVKRQTPSNSRNGLELLTHCQCRDLLARYTKRTYSQVMKWKHSKQQMLVRLRKFVDAASKRNRELKKAREKKKKKTRQ